MGKCRSTLSLLRLLVLAGLALSLGFQKLSAATITKISQTVNFNLVPEIKYTTGNFLKFDTKLGTLKSVNLTVNSFSLGGSLTLTQGSAGTTVISALNYSLIFLQASSTDSTNHNGLISNYDFGKLPSVGALQLANQTYPRTITRRTSATFNLVTVPNLLTTPVVVFNSNSENDLQYYRGQGISFAPAFTSITHIFMTGTFSGTRTWDYSRFNSSVNMSLVYDYIPAMIPEPQSYGWSLGLGALSVAIIRRRRRIPPAPRKFA